MYRLSDSSYDIFYLRGETMILKCNDYIKLIVLKITPFFSEIIDERNFNTKEEFAIAQFKKNYIGRDDCVIVKIDM